MDILVANLLAISIMVPYTFYRKAKHKKLEKGMKTLDGFEVNLDDLSKMSGEIRFLREEHYIGVNPMKFLLLMTFIFAFFNTPFSLVGSILDSPLFTFFGGLVVSAIMIQKSMEGESEMIACFKDMARGLQLYSDDEHQQHGKYVNEPAHYRNLKEYIEQEEKMLRLIQKKQEKISKKKTPLEMLENHVPVDIVTLAKLEKKWKKQKAKELDSKSRIEKLTKEISEVLTDVIPSDWEHVIRSIESEHQKKEHEKQNKIQDAEIAIQIAKQYV